MSINIPNVFEQPKIMLLGKNRQVGWELTQTLSPLGHVVALDRNQLNFADSIQIRNCVRKIKPDIIVNAAAYTDVEKAEEDIKTAEQVNSIAPGILAEEAKRIGAILIHYSTDFVFDGTKDTPYKEDDIPNPLNVYARTKLAGENAILASGGYHFILRTSWVYGLRRNNFMLNILRLAQERNQINVVIDQIGSPTWSRLIAELTSLMLARGRSFLMDKQGIYHLTAGGQVSRYQFAKAILEKIPGTKADVKLVPVRSKDFFSKVRRPMFSVLSNAKLYETFGLTLPEWDYSLDMVAQQFLAPQLSKGAFL